MTAIGGLLGLVVSLLFLAVQTRAVSRQVRAANNLAGTRALDHSLTSLREVHFKMLEYPGTRAPTSTTANRVRVGVRKERVLMFSELLADVLDTGIQATRRIPENESDEDWLSYCRFLLHRSPALRATVTEHSNWWPDLAALC
ncbi:hypothetical protein ACFWVP_33600 [Streptomyces sp. NPDC058637]|uniref:hypothetical protein n=1 Tax=Streptomyces sp. NPDC058637 TaxID=3346569 RepID=UPI0036663C6E